MRATSRHRRFRLGFLATFLYLVGGAAIAHAATDKTQISFGSERTYQGPGGDIRFTVAGDAKSQPDLIACLRWKVPNATCDDKSARALNVRVIKETADPVSVSYAVTIPRDLPNPPANVELATFYFPIAELAITATNPDKTSSVIVREVEITSRWIAGLAAIAAILIAGTVLYRFAKYLGVPGPEVPAGGVVTFIAQSLHGFSVPLRIISSGEGWASLSQFQIILWTFVVGAGAVYVMTLTGTLIVIGNGTLALLGIAGAATVLAEVKTAQEARPQPSLGLPGAVNLSLVEARATEIALSWLPSAIGALPSAYIVQYQEAGGPWRLASTVLRGASLLHGTSFRIVGLRHNVACTVQVTAMNGAGSGPAASLAATTANIAPTAASVTNLHAGAGITGTAIPLQWDTVAGATYVLEQRPHDGDADWTEIQTGITETQTIIRNLRANTAYDFRIATNAAPHGWSAVATITTGTRVPKWSDIITDTDKPAGIDVTRVQMLFFTVISAIFVALNIIDTATIPAIDPTYVTLMGISNGVYVTAKFVRN